MQPSELEWLAEKATTHSSIVEVGSFLGRTTCVLAQHTPGIVFAFDDWKGPRDVVVEKVVVNGEIVTDHPMSMYDLVSQNRLDLYGQFQENIQGLSNIRILRADHADSSAIPDDLVPDMVFVDGNHSYEDTRRDILTWKDRLRPGGLLCGHDAQMDGVFQALMELFPGRWRLEALTDIWCLYD
jgi:hypothetical protein